MTRSASNARRALSSAAEFDALGLDAEGCARLERAVLQAERDTAGELVFAAVRACDEYGSAGWLLGVGLAALAYLGLAIFSAPLPLWSYLVAQGLALGAGHGLARIEALRRRLLPAALVERRVAQRARLAFADNGLDRTAGRTGILIFVALLEHRVVVLGDSGIDDVLHPDESWQEVVDLAVAGLRTGKSLDGFEAAIARCGEILHRHLPASHPNLDELPNAVVLYDD